MRDDRVEIILWRRWNRKGSSREGWDFFAINNHGNNEVTVVELDDIRLFESWFELLDKDWRIVGRNAERDGGTDVAKDGVADGISHLGDVLVSHREVKAVLAGLGKNHGEGISGEVLELIYVEVEWTAIVDIFERYLRQ